MTRLTLITVIIYIILTIISRLLEKCSVYVHFVIQVLYGMEKIFTIFVFERTTKNAYLLYWNEQDLLVKDVSNQEIVTWCSSTLYSSDRRETINQLFNQNTALNNDEIIQLHDQLKMNRGDLYDFLATTSISQIIVKDSEIDMKYCQFF